MTFEPIVEAIRSALRAIDRDPRSVPNYLELIRAYERCADQEGEPELLEQAGYVILDVKKLPMSEAETRRLAELEERVVATLSRLRAAKPEP